MPTRTRRNVAVAQGHDVWGTPEQSILGKHPARVIQEGTLEIFPTVPPLVHTLLQTLHDFENRLRIGQRARRILLPKADDPLLIDYQDGTESHPPFFVP